MSEPRKASDVLLELESKIDLLLDMVRSQDFNIKVLSNKLSEVMKSLEKSQALSPKATIEAVQSPLSNQMAAAFGQAPPNGDPQRMIPITAESKLPMEENPKGFRRNSRPESYEGDATYLKKEGVPAPRNEAVVNKPPPGRSVGDMLTAPTPAPKNKAAPSPISQTKVAAGTDAHSVVPVEQRVVDRNGKSVFLADVEIIDVSSGQQISKSRTNATGKWMAALPLGSYKVTVRKLESMTREKVEAIQTVQVDGSESPLRLAMVIIK